MARTQTIRNSFNAGEISPYTLGRTDLEKYHTACESLQNYIPLLQGGCTRRPGSMYIEPAMGPSRLVPFKFSRTQAYVLEFGNKKLRFYTQGGQIQSGGSAYEISTPYDTATDNLWDLKFAQDADIMYITHPNHAPRKLNRLADTNWILNQPNFRPPPTHDFDQDVGTDKTATLTPGAVTGAGITFTASNPVFIKGDVGKSIVAGPGVGYIGAVGGASAVDGTTGATLYPEATVDIIDDFASTAAIAAGSWFLRGSPNAYAAIGATSGGNWFNSRQLGPGARQVLHTYATPPLDSDTAPNSSGGTNTYVEPAHTDCFRTLDLGSYILFQGAVLQIHAVTDSAHVDVELLSVIRVTFPDFQGNQQAQPAASGTWSIETVSFSAANGYPRACCFFQDRLAFAGTASQPNTIWLSVVDDFENFAKGNQADDSIDDTINSGFREQIQWLAAYQGVIAAGTLESEYIISGGASTFGGNGAAITPDNVSDTIQSRYGVSSIQPIFVENDLVYVQRALLTAYQFSYDIQQSVYASKNLNVLHDLITTAGFKEFSYHQIPYRLLWFVDTAGNLVSLTYERDQDVWAWARHFTGADNGDQVISVAVIPSDNGLGDDLWLNVKRGSTYNIELISVNLPPESLLDAASIFTSATPVTSISGVTYLAGRTVYLRTSNSLVDWAVLGPYVVPAGGTIDFSRALPEGALNVIVGLPYTSTIQTVRLEIAGGNTIQGLIKRWARAWVRVYNSVGITINGQAVPFRTPSDPMTQGVPPETIDVLINDLTYDRDGRVLIQQTQPLPSNILALFGSVNVGEI